MELVSGKIPSAIKALIYGPEGIGKSSFASKFPNPVFIDTEGGTTHMNVVRTPTPSSWSMLIDQVKYFIKNPHLLGTLVLDTADWAEKMCIDHICAIKQVKGIEDIGYGRGYIYVAEEFGRLLNLLTELKDKGIHILFTAHAIMRKFEQPDEMGAYDRWELKLGKKTAPLCKEWVDMVLLANYKTYVVNVDNQGAVKGKNKAQGGSRVIYATHHPAWDAKNRHGLPDEFPLDFVHIAHIFNTQPQPQHSVQHNVQQSQHSEPIATKHTQQSQHNEETDTNIPRSLRDLMQQHGVKEFEIQMVVSNKGYYPADTPIANYDSGFIDGVLVAAWDKVYGVVQENRLTLPF